MRTASTFLLAALLAVPAFAADDAKPKAGDKPPVDKSPIVVPFELLTSRHMAVEVMINGKGPYRLVFDTGAPMNLINNKIAKESGVLDPKAKKPGGFNLFGSMGAHEVKTLEIGGAKLEKVPTVVMDHPTVAAISEALGPIDGIIGFPFFARYKMTVDYQKRELTLVPNDYVPGDYLEGMMNKMMDAQKQKEPKVLVPAGLWGFSVDKDMEDEDAGVMVKTVHGGGAAASAGLKVGDRVLTIDGRWTDSLTDAYLAATLVKPGREAIVVVKRAGKDVKLTVKVAKGV